MLTLAEITTAFTYHLNHDFHNPFLFKAEHKGERDGFTVGEFTYHGGKPEHVFTKTFEFRKEDWDDRVILYFIPE